MNTAHVQSTGGFVSGEVKLSLTLRLLAGGTYMGLALLYEVGMTYAYKIFTMWYIIGLMMIGLPISMEKIT